ncbi:MAG: hypothetical protein FJX80_08110 [Bacteroidetes bacterium]|nr:hypothetical protein [Bacteroidota bacterium]
MNQIDFGIEVALGALCIWFGIVELSEIFVHSWRYFLNFWRILNFVPIILILHNIFSSYLLDLKSNIDPFNVKIFWDIQAMAALALWGKFLYILRSFD